MTTTLTNFQRRAWVCPESVALLSLVWFTFDTYGLLARGGRSLSDFR
jgi:hypothetical protein